MKTNCWLILGMLIGAGALAQDNTNALPPMPAPLVAPPAEAAPAAAPVVEPAKKPAPVNHKKVVAPKRAALHEPDVRLAPGAAEVVASSLNVRGQAGLRGEVITHVHKGETVMVLDEIKLDKHEVGEPAQWAKIALPANIHVWVSKLFVDADTKTVKANRLNLRAGPGENYSVVGVIERGETVKGIESKGNWMQIEAPANAYAFVAAMYLKQEASGSMAANVEPSTETEPAVVATTPAPAAGPAPTPEPAPTPTAVQEAQPIVAEPATNSTGVAAAATPGNNPSNPSAAATATAAAAAAGTSEADTNLPAPPRVVSHEGVVGRVDSLIAPTEYELYDPTTRQEINYLYTTSTNLDIGRYYGMRIIATGEEALAERWPNTPVLTIQRIQVLETNAIPKVYYPTPRQRN